MVPFGPFLDLPSGGVFVSLCSSLFLSERRPWREVARRCPHGSAGPGERRRSSRRCPGPVAVASVLASCCCRLGGLAEDTGCVWRFGGPRRAWMAGRRSVLRCCGAKAFDCTCLAALECPVKTSWVAPKPKRKEHVYRTARAHRMGPASSDGPGNSVVRAPPRPGDRACIERGKNFSGDFM